MDWNALLQWFPLLLSAMTLIGSAVAWLASSGKRRVDLTEQLTGAAVDAAVSLIEPLEKRVDHLEEENGKLRGRTQVLEDENDQLKRRASQLERDSQALRGRIKVLEEENETLKLQVSHLESENAKLIRANRELKKQIQNAQQGNGNHGTV